MINVIPLFSGSTGNSVYIKCDRAEFLVDAGVSCRMLETALREAGTSLSNISGIFVTHEHNDHIKGIDMIAKKYEIPVYINTNSAKYIYCNDSMLNLQRALEIFNPGEELKVCGVKVSAFKTPHDSWGCSSFRFCDTDGDTFGIATDIGYVSKSVASALLGCRQVVIESNHDIDMLKNGVYPQYLKARISGTGGHLSNDDCARFLPYLAKEGAERIFLAHLSKENNHPELALECAKSALSDYPGTELSVCREK